jgi:hypothetical protein
MDRLKEAYSNNKKLFVVGAIAGAVALTGYAVTRSRKSHLGGLTRAVDALFD